MLTVWLIAFGFTFAVWVSQKWLASKSIFKTKSANQCLIWFQPLLTHRVSFITILNRLEKTIHLLIWNWLKTHCWSMCCQEEREEASAVSLKHGCVAKPGTTIGQLKVTTEKLWPLWRRGMLRFGDFCGIEINTEILLGSRILLPLMGENTLTGSNVKNKRWLTR